MPAFYAHYRFGQEVMRELPEELQQQIQKYRELYEIGLHGPDILFFYHPVRRHPVGQIGVRIHHELGRTFFEQAIPAIRNSDRQEAMLVYGMGAVCHLALDAACHPYINRYEKQAGISHHEIEKELEKYLMKKDGEDPFHWDFRKHLSTKMTWAKLIAAFYGLRPVQIHQSIEGFLTFSRLFFTTGRWKRTAIFIVLRLAGCYRETRGFFANQTDNGLCRISNRRLEELMKENVPVAAAMIEELNEAVFGDGRLSAWYDRSFS